MMDVNKHAFSFIIQISTLHESKIGDQRERERERRENPQKKRLSELLNKSCQPVMMLGRSEH